jgi:NAD(P)-dependent dehydrogenase (short-subunit alcohol dehydrogenase family)
LRRLAEAGDVADSIVFLLSGEARHITGVELFVDGGESVF